MEKYTYEEMHDILVDGFHLMHFPVAVKFFFKDEELEEFKQNTEYYTSQRNLTFCQYEIGPRMTGQTLLVRKEHFGCTNAMYCFGWKGFDEAEVKSHLKYCRSYDQAEKFVKSKPRLPEGTLKAIAVSPLADTYFAPDTVHFYCDNLQAYHLAVDYMAAMDIHPLKTNITINSSACSGNVYCYLEKTANMCTACSGSYNAGKTEKGELNFFVPGIHLEALINRMAERIKKHGTASITRPGDNFPGAAICKNCNLIVYKKGESA
ncbi:MAG: DUF169 domain-containing protein [Bacteroidota bacterium]